MKNLTHKDILDYLRKEGILYKEIEDENDEGELEIKGIELNSIAGIMRDMQERRRDLDALIKDLKTKIKENRGGVYFEKLNEVVLKDKVINFQKDCYFLDCNSMAFISNSIAYRRKKMGERPMITMVSQDKK
jgi:hypothetical protein